METKKNSAIGITGLIFGIISVLLSCILVGGFTGIIGVVLCILSLIDKNAKKGFAIAGLILNTFAIVIVTIVLLASVSEKGKTEKPSVDQASDYSESYVSEEHNENEGYATIEKFNEIKTGMTYDEVVEIMGSEGTVVSEAGMDGIVTTIYCWKSMFGVANMNVTVANGKVIAKAQFGLD